MGRPLVAGEVAFAWWRLVYFVCFLQILYRGVEAKQQSITGNVEKTFNVLKLPV